MKRHCDAAGGGVECPNDAKRSKRGGGTQFSIEDILERGEQRKDDRNCGRTSTRATAEEDHDKEVEWDDTKWLRPKFGGDGLLKGLSCELENAEHWQKFNQLGTEMIITKSGRRMFPVLKLRFTGTLPGHAYYAFVDVVPIEGRCRFRYRYDKSQWQEAGKAEVQPFGRLFLHPEAPFSGGEQYHSISFDKAKLTNKAETSNSAEQPGVAQKSTDSDQLLLNSMHKYHPRVHVLCVPIGHRLDLPSIFRTGDDLKRFARYAYKTFVFPETKFVAVTAYQNQLVTRAKIELNPFAKGFRDPKSGEDAEEGEPLKATVEAAAVKRAPQPAAPNATGQENSSRKRRCPPAPTTCLSSTASLPHPLIVRPPLPSAPPLLAGVRACWLPPPAIVGFAPPPPIYSPPLLLQQLIIQQLAQWQQQRHHEESEGEQAPEEGDDQQEEREEEGIVAKDCLITT